MKSGLSWNLRGVDDETREAVLEAARRSGLTVGEWLNQVLAEDGVEHGEPEDTPPPQADEPEPGEDRQAANLAEAIERLTKRLAAMDDKARASITDLKDRLDGIESHVGTLSGPATSAEWARSMATASAMVADLAREIDNADERARSTIEGLAARAAAPAPVAQPAIDVDRVKAAINELDQRIASMGLHISVPPRPAPAEPPPAPIAEEQDLRPLRLEEIRARLDALLAQAPARAAQPQQAAVIDAALRGLESRIDSAKAQLEARMATREAQAQAAAATNEQIARIEQHLAEIGGRLASAEAEKQKPRKEAELASAIREISSHQRNIDERAETLAMRRDQKALAAAMGALRTDITALGEQVNAISRIGAEEHGAFFELARRIDALAAEKPLDRNLLNAIRADLETMRGMVEGGARQETLGTLELRHDGIAAQLSDLLRITPERSRLDELGEEISALRRSLEADDSPRAIARLEMRVSELGRAIEATLSTRKVTETDPAIARLEGRMQEIAGLIENLGDTSAQTAAIVTVEQRLQDRMDEIANRLGGLFVTAAKPQAAAIEAAQRQLDGRLEEINTRLGGLMDARPQREAIETVQRQIDGRLEEINTRLGGLMEARPQREAIETAQRHLEGRLEEIVDRLGGMFDTTSQDAALGHVHERLQAITDRIDTLSASQREPSAALDAIKSEIGSLRFEIAEKQQQQPSGDYLENQIRALAMQLETVSTSKVEGTALADLEARVTTLAGELDRTKPRVAALDTVEDSLKRLQAMLADTAQESIANARAEARKAVDELSQAVAGNEIDADLIHGLMRDLDSLRNAAGSSDQATRSKLESVSATMTQVVDRLSRLEKETTAPKPAVAQPAEPPVIAKIEPAQLLWKSGFRTVADEPAAKAAAAPTPVATPAAEKRPLDRRADFIAAARRAAQAAAEEVAAFEAPAVEITPQSETEAEDQIAAERKPGAFARISQAIRNRKRPLLLAAAAIVLAIGAMQIYGKVSALVGNNALVASANVVSSNDQPAATPTLRHVEIVASNVTSPAPTAAAATLIPPAAAPDAPTTFAPPVAVDNQFTASTAAPVPAPVVTGAAPDTTTAAADTTDASAPAATDNAPPVATADASADSPAADSDGSDNSAGPMVLASAQQPATTSIGGLDSRLGSPKLLTAAASGDPAAEFEIATRYAEGATIGKDLAKAADWYEKAAEGGVAVAQYRLGSLYERGQGVTKDLTSAVNWYQRAADQGNVNAMHNLAVLMSEGADGPPDHDKALQWFLAAGNYGVRDSQYNLGVIYARGLGASQDLIESYKWFAIAAAQGDTDASARRDEVAAALSADDLAKARAAVSAWHVKAPIAEANAVATPAGGWDGPAQMIGQADRQALVKKIQTLLADQGFDPGPPDGVAGPKTVDAVRAYQHKVGVAETGQIDNTLMASLNDTPN